MCWRSTNPPGTPVNSFTQLDIDNGSLSFVHNGSETLADDFIFEVDDGLGNVASNQVFNITVPVSYTHLTLPTTPYV